MPDELVIYTDGGSRGNPGPAAAAFILTGADKKQLCAKGFFIGQATNNVAEYIGAIKAMETARQIGAKRITVFSDSELLVRQINGQYRVKNEQLKPLFLQAVELLNGFESWKVRHITRDKNKHADKLVNQVFDTGSDIDMTQVCEQNKRPVRLGVLISGSGTTMINILEYIKSGRLNAEIAVVISSRSNVAGVERARAAGLDLKIIRKKDYADVDKFSEIIADELVAAKVDLVVQAGWLCLWNIPERFDNCVMNIHPALLPSFGGQGKWGHYVHEAVLEAGCKVSGCTVHFCTNEYDKGPIIVQRTCPVRENDTPETLAARVFEQECIAYPEAIKLFQEGRLHVDGGLVKIGR